VPTKVRILLALTVFLDSEEKRPFLHEGLRTACRTTPFLRVDVINRARLDIKTVLGRSTVSTSSCIEERGDARVPLGTAQINQKVEPATTDQVGGLQALQACALH
jgi:hypothetical protein